MCLSRTAAASGGQKRPRSALPRPDPHERYATLSSLLLLPPLLFSAAAPAAVGAQAEQQQRGALVQSPKTGAGAEQKRREKQRGSERTRTKLTSHRCLPVRSRLFFPCLRPLSDRTGLPLPHIFPLQLSRGTAFSHSMSSRLLSSASPLLLMILALVSFATPTQGLYFHVQEGGRRCFLEEVPEVSRLSLHVACTRCLCFLGQRVFECGRYVASRIWSALPRCATGCSSSLTPQQLSCSP
jgi:hypothetical protein